MRFLRWLLIVTIALQGFAPALALARVENSLPSASPITEPKISLASVQETPLAPLDDPALVYAPAELPAGVAVTISVDPAEIAAGGTITILGQGAPANVQVRLAVVSEGKTLGIRAVAANASGGYTAEIPVDATYPTGSVQICAFVSGIENAEVTCTTLIITPPAKGSVSGQLPLDAVSVANADAIDAEFQLMNAAGAVLYTTALLADGAFSLTDVAPGAYLYAVTGRVPHLTDLGSLIVQPKKNNFIELAVRKTCSIAALVKPTTALNVNPSRVEFTQKSRTNGLFRTYEDVRRPFGLYVTGVENNVTFTASPQVTGAVDKVVFEFYGVKGQLIQRLEDASPPYSVVFDVGRLPASKGNIHPYVMITPVVAGTEQCASFYDIEVMGNPMASRYLQPLPNSHTTWHGVSRTYRFEGILPYVEDVLPAHYSLGTVPFLGEIKNDFNTGVYVKGDFDLEGKARIFLVEVFADAVLLSLPILPPGDRKNITPPGFGLARFDIRNPAHMAIPYGPLELYQRDLFSVPFAKILIFTYFGIFNAYVSGGLNFGVGLYLEGVVRPLAPALDSTLTGNASFAAELGLSADILFGLVEGGVGLGGQVCVNVPLRVILAAEPNVFFDHPFVGGRLYLVAWASAFWGVVKKRTTSTIEDFGPGCPSVAAVGAESDPPAPDVFRSPAVAASFDGGMLAAYVENTVPPDATPQVQILVRFQDADTGEWSEPEAISNPAHSAQSPTVAFVGPNQLPMVAWTENTLTAEEAAALGDENPAAHMLHQEIFYRLWFGNDGWGAPIRLTNDQLADGLAEAAATHLGAVIAWTTDLDGNANTRGDQRIAVSTYDPAFERFGTPQLLGYPDASLDNNVLNNDVAVAIDNDGYAYVAWVYDLDADLTTSYDRHLAVVYGNDGDWAYLNTDVLPNRVDSPTITFSSAGLQAAFLVRKPTPDGEVGVLGTNGELWTALYSNDEWSMNRMQDAAGDSIYAEQPDLEHAEDESLLIFRRFDEQSERGPLGQISLSRLSGAELPRPPLNLTDASDQQWMPVIAIDPINSHAVVVHSALGIGVTASAADVAAPLASGQALPAAQAGTLQSSANPVLFLDLENDADPALDPLQVSAQAPVPGTTLTITATVRNVGRRETSAVTVSLYQGQSAGGTLMAAKVVPDILEFNATATLVFSFVVPTTFEGGGQLPLYVELVTNGENITTANDAATLSLGGLSAPSRVELVGENPEFEGAMDMAWSGNVGEYVTGYRILRAATPAGPWALVGESAVPSFTDTIVTLDQTYCYAVQAYNAQGALSMRGAAACASLPNNTAPVAAAGADQSVSVGATISLNGSGSSDPDGHLPLTYQWQQTEGAAVVLTTPGSVTAGFTAPATAGILTFALTVTDSKGLASAPDTVRITVNNLPGNLSPSSYLPLVEQ